MLKIYQSEPKTREASINYTIAGIWIRNEVNRIINYNKLNPKFYFSPKLKKV